QRAGAVGGVDLRLEGQRLELTRRDRRQVPGDLVAEEAAGRPDRARVAGVARVARVGPGAVGVARVPRIAGIARGADRARVAGVAGVAGVGPGAVGVAGVPRIAGMAGVARRAARADRPGIGPAADAARDDRELRRQAVDDLDVAQGGAARVLDVD